MDLEHGNGNCTQDSPYEDDYEKDTSDLKLVQGKG
jgi:hypothetical protein